MSTSNGHRDSKAPKRDPLKPPHRRLVLMFDGTGNKRLNLSNVARMFEAIDDSKPDDYKSYTEGGPAVSSRDPALEPVQLLRYIKGVGTDVLGHLSGLGFGFGLSANVKAGYVWLSEQYCEGDEIFVFGFSRGAFSARSLVSLVHRCGGVLKKKSKPGEKHQELKENDQVVLKAYDLYQAYVQTTTADGTDKEDRARQQDHFDALQDFKTTTEKDGFRVQHVTVKMLGVWDTVGAVGIPETKIKVVDDHVYPFSRYNSKQYQFHDQGLSCIVENAYHALAIDEHRKHFKPTLWNEVTPENQEVKQVWFVGSHCNVGGGADLEDLNDPDDLWQYSYVWMQKHAMKHGLRFYWTYDSPPTQSSSNSQGTPLPTRRVSLRKTEDSYALFLGGFYQWIFKRFYREATEQNGAKLHWSVIDRIALSVEEGKGPPYRPPTLFGQSERQLTKVAELDIDLVRKRWPIETDDADDAVETSDLPQLPERPCNCGNEVAAPPKKTGFWSWFGL